MPCKLYYKVGRLDYYIGEFKNREKAVAHWNLIKTFVADKVGSGAVPIYVESSRRRS